MTDSGSANPLSPEERDRRVLQLYDQLLEIEQRLIPTGLHIFGRPAETGERADMLRMIASFDRPEVHARALPDLVAEGLGFSSYDSILRSASVDEASFRHRERIDSIVSQAISEFVKNGPT